MQRNLYGVCLSVCLVDHAMICKRGGFVIQRHNVLADVGAKLLNTVCSDVQVQPVFQDISGEHLGRGANLAQEAGIDIHVSGF